MITYLILNGADLQDLNSKPLPHRSRYLEAKRPEDALCGAQLAHTEPSRRLLKTHLSEHVLEKGIRKGQPRVIVVMRNPKDTLVSFYHFHKKMPFLAYPGTWNDFFEMYRKKGIYYGDVIEYNAGWWKHHHDDNFLFLWFEDMKHDLRSAVQQIARHCHMTLTPEQLDRIAEHSEFTKMKTSYAVKSAFEPFKVPVTDILRKGEVGDWRNYFTPEQSAYVEAEMAKWFDPIGLRFPCD